MELQLYMLKSYDNQTISDMTGINVNTISEWRIMMSELENAGIRTMRDRNKIIVARKINVSEFIANSVKNMGIQLLEFS